MPNAVLTAGIAILSRKQKEIWSAYTLLSKILLIRKKTHATDLKIIFETTLGVGVLRSQQSGTIST